MFRKNKNSPDSPANPKPVGKKESRKETIPSVINRDFHILGNIISDAAVDFDGTIEGNVRCKSFILRTNGVVKGEIIAEDVSVYGKLSGLIRAKNVQLFAGSIIEGIVMHESISIEDGAFIDGKCKRTDKPMSEEDSASEDTSTAFKALENLRLIAG